MRNLSDSLALVAPDGVCTYHELADATDRVAAGLLTEGGDLEEARVAFAVAPGVAHAAVLHGIWRAGGVAAPAVPCRRPIPLGSSRG